MKNIIIAAALTLILASSALTQSRQLFGKYTLITTTRDSLYLGGAYVHLRITNEAATDSMFVWTSADSSNQAKILHGETANFDGLQARWIKRKSANFNIPSRVTAW